MSVLSQKYHGCTRCGNCCRARRYPTRMTKEEFEEYSKLAPKAVLKYIAKDSSGHHWCFVDPDTRDFFDTCPFLVEGNDGTCACQLHSTCKPMLCQRFPATVVEVVKMLPFCQGIKGVPANVLEVLRRPDVSEVLGSLAGDITVDCLASKQSEKKKSLRKMLGRHQLFDFDEASDFI
jgi:Fe-S-cluster containining protein